MAAHGGERGPGPPPVPGSPRAGRRRSLRGPRIRPPRFGLVLAVALPALFGAGAVLLVGGSADPGLRSPGSPPEVLARLAEAPQDPLRPVAARPGRAGLEPSPLEPVEGGIRPAPPVRIRIPAARVDAPVRAVRQRGRALQVPAVGTAGWFEGGPRPGEPGRAIVIGHLDSRRGPGLFARVPSLPPGTLVSILDRRGGLHRYAVVGGAEVRKEAFPARFVYGHADSPVLVLITCGGPFRAGRGYRDNVLLYARAV